MINKELLEILCCPETKQDVTIADNILIAAINKAIYAQELSTRGGTLIKEKIDAGLLREDKKYLYPIRSDIPVMLIDEGIPCEKFL